MWISSTQFLFWFLLYPYQYPSSVPINILPWTTHASGSTICSTTMQPTQSPPMPPGRFTYPPPSTYTEIFIYIDPAKRPPKVVGTLWWITSDPPKTYPTFSWPLSYPINWVSIIDGNYRVITVISSW